MKRFRVVLLCFLLGTCSAFAENWDFFSLGVTETFPEDKNITICGIKAGVPMSYNTAPVYGLEGALFWGGCEKVAGVKCSLIATGGKAVAGLQLALLNFAGKVAGLQLGLFNSAKDSAFQIGLLNHIENSSVPWMPLVNFKFCSETQAKETVK
ncbi:MAG: hypothetical protein PHS41_01855 [Victivallaceae bacterium]|nr:hypothetical protein [Victivallaceae bacterium]